MRVGSDAALWDIRSADALFIHEPPRRIRFVALLSPIGSLMVEEG